MVVFIAVIATVNLALGYWLAKYLGPANAAAAVAAAAAVEPPPEPPTADEVAELIERDEPDAEAAERPIADEAEASADHTEELAPAAESDAPPPQAGIEEAEKEEEAGEEADLLAGIESFRAQLAESARRNTEPPEQTPFDEAAAEVQDTATAPIDADAAETESDSTEPVDTEVLAGIEAFRAQLAELQGGQVESDGDPRRKIIDAASAD